MPINAHPDYLAAEKEYLLAQTLDSRIEKLKKMISLAPGHKGAENLRAQLTTRMKRLKGQLAKAKKIGKSTQKGIKKEDLQAVVVGFTNTGKSSLLKLLTNANPVIAEYDFSTKKPIIGMMPSSGTSIQLIEVPALGSEYYDKGLVHTADAVLILIDDLSQLEKMKKVHGNQLIVFNKIDLLNEKEKRKIRANLSSKKYAFALVSAKTGKGIEELKKKLFPLFKKIRVFTKEPGKEKTNRPLILRPEATVAMVAEKILKGFSKKVKETKIWGPSSKFSGQKVGLKHKLKDLDVFFFFLFHLINLFY